MPKAIIFFSSQNGSTAIAAARAARALVDSSWTCAAEDIKRAGRADASRKTDVSGYDLVGFFCPTYVSRPSFAMTDFFRSLAGFEGKPAFALATYGTEIGDGLNLLRREIARAGGMDAGALALKSKNLFPGYAGRGYVFNPAEPSPDSLAAIPAFARKAAARASNGGPFGTDPWEPKPKAIYRFERFALNRFLVRRFYSRFISFDQRACVECGACSANCPTGNIAEDGKGRKRAGEDCVFCLKCEIACPAKAVRSPINWLIFRPFLSFNVQTAIKKGIPYSRSA